MSSVPPEARKDQIDYLTLDPRFLEPTIKRGEELFRKVEGFIYGLDKKSPEVKVCGFDGGENPWRTIEQPRGEIFGATMIEFHIAIINPKDRHVPHNPAMMAAHSLVHCIGILEAAQLRALDAEKVDMMPLYTHARTHNVWEGLLGMIIFQKGTEPPEGGLEEDTLEIPPELVRREFDEADKWKLNRLSRDEPKSVYEARRSAIRPDRTEP